jgi:urea transport system ATP-binding protein
LSSQPLLSVDAVDVRIGNREILSGISIAIPEGSITAVLGHNGAGKSTLLRSIMGLLPIDRGSIMFGGVSLDRASVAQRCTLGLGMVPQQTGTFPNLTVAENLELARGRKRSGIDTSEIFPELTKLSGRTVETLSGGQRQMVAVAMEFTRGPKMLMLDEPTLGVQPSRVTSMMAAVAHYRRENGTTVLLVEQDFDRVRKLADTVVILNNGRVVLIDAPGNLESGDVITYL